MRKQLTHLLFIATLASSVHAYATCVEALGPAGATRLSSVLDKALTIGALRLETVAAWLRGSLKDDEVTRAIPLLPKYQAVADALVRLLPAARDANDTKAIATMLESHAQRVEQTQVAADATRNVGFKIRMLIQGARTYIPGGMRIHRLKEPSFKFFTLPRQGTFAARMVVYRGADGIESSLEVFGPLEGPGEMAPRVGRWDLPPARDEKPTWDLAVIDGRPEIYASLENNIYKVEFQNPKPKLVPWPKFQMRVRDYFQWRSNPLVALSQPKEMRIHGAVGTVMLIQTGQHGFALWDLKTGIAKVLGRHDSELLSFSADPQGRPFAVFISGTPTKGFTLDLLHLANGVATWRAQPFKERIYKVDVAWDGQNKPWVSLLSVSRSPGGHHYSANMLSPANALTSIFSEATQILREGTEEIGIYWHRDSRGTLHYQLGFQKDGWSYVGIVEIPEGGEPKSRQAPIDGFERSSWVQNSPEPILTINSANYSNPEGERFALVDMVDLSIKEERRTPIRNSVPLLTNGQLLLTFGFDLARISDINVGMGIRVLLNDDSYTDVRDWHVLQDGRWVAETETDFGSGMVILDAR